MSFASEFKSVTDRQTADSKSPGEEVAEEMRRKRLQEENLASLRHVMRKQSNKYAQALGNYDEEI